MQMRTLYFCPVVSLFFLDLSALDAGTPARHYRVASIASLTTDRHLGHFVHSQLMVPRR